MDYLERTTTLIGENNVKKLQNSRILLFGLGGVGGYTFEALLRAGIRHIDIVDNDSFDITNINRQILATTDSIGCKKTDVAIKRAKLINPDAKINTFNIFYLPNCNIIDFSQYDFVIDAIDTMTAKIDIIVKCHQHNIPLISCMGTGNKLDATKLCFADIYQTQNCKVAKIIRKLCKDNKIDKQMVLYSTELPNNRKKSFIPSSISYLPGVAGLLLAQYVITSLLKD